MSAQIIVLKETQKNETRVAISPEIVKKFTAMGADISIESGAGAKAHFSDADYSDAGAQLIRSAGAALKKADIVLAVNAPAAARLKGTKKGAAVLALFAPHKNKANIAAFGRGGWQALAMELMPRITRAQSMDVLSSQSNLAGYKSVLDACAVYGRALPMMMTAAGTIPAARVFVMGAGVAGLQAIATAKRLGAVVSATDVRAVAAEQVESLGGTFVMVEQDEDESGETAGGYAKEMSADYQARQAALVSEHIAKQDIVICTALIPGRPAPQLVSKAMVESMKPGAVIVDLAVEQGGNCPLSATGKTVTHKGVHIIGHENVPGRLAGNASELYARNLYNFIAAFWNEEKKIFAPDWEDEIIQAIGLTRDGAVIHADFMPKAKASPKKAASKKATTRKTSSTKGAKK